MAVRSYLSLLPPAILVWSLCLSQRALAQQACPVSERPVVELTTRVKPPDQLIADTLQAHLTASLKERGIDLCLGSAAPRKPVGHVLLEVRRPDGGPVVALIQIGDNVTDKRVARDMLLTSVPADARPAAVSAAADELLRASWAELLISDAPPTKMKPPAAVLTAVASSVKPVSELTEPVPEEAPPAIEEHTVRVGAMATGALYKRMKTLGADVRADYWYQEQLGVYLRGRFAFSASESGVNGTVRMQSQGGGLGLQYAFWPIRRVASLAVEAEMSMHRVDFIPRRNGVSVVESRLQDWTLEAALGPRGSLTFGPVQLTLGVAVRIAARPANANDSGTVVLSNAHVGAETAFGLHFLL